MTEFNVGDEVFYYGYGGSVCRLTVSRLTSTQIVTSDGSRWRKDNQEIIGGGKWSSVSYATLHRMTPEAKRKAVASAARTFLSQLPALTDDQAIEACTYIKNLLGKDS